MKKIALLALSLLLFSCSKDEFDNASRNVVTEDGATSFEDLLLLISIKASDSSYLVVNSIDSLNIFVNGKHWAKTNSNQIDTSLIEYYSTANMNVSGDIVNYLVVSDQEIEDPEMPTAGAYADYLNAVYQLSAGEYACYIESFQLEFKDGTTETFYPMTYRIFDVEEKEKTVFVGEFEFKIY